MLGKLLKYEIKSTGRILLPMYGATLLLALLTRLFLYVGSKNILPKLFFLPTAGVTLFYGLAMFALFVMVLVLIVQRFYKNLMGDEGYLMFTLPATPTHHIFAKLITGMMWTLASVLVVVLSLMAAFLDLPSVPSIFGGFTELLQDLGKVPAEYMAHGWLLLFEWIGLVLFGTAANILMIYASIAIGQLFNKHKLLASFGAYFGISAVFQLLNTLALIPLGMAINTTHITTWLDTFFETNPLGILHLMFGGCAGVCLVLCVLFFFTTDILLRKRLNLD
ncbi:MAG: hypothetical protein PHD32_05445 [Eubacteriales bacterium]|nr:hypothetical protein [Eubacteriales bacterium]